MDKRNAAELEWENTLRALADQNGSLPEFSFFLNAAKKYYGKKPDAPRVILIGHYFPEEILRAMGIDFCYAFGGSYAGTLVSDIAIPKDVDDETRSLIGLLSKSSSNDVILLPIYNDSIKKLKTPLSDIATVICFELPSDKGDPLQQKRFENEIKRVTGELKKHFKRRLTAAKLKEQCLLSEKASASFAELEQLYGKSSALSASALLFVASSYHMCNDKAEWTAHLESLTAELRTAPVSPDAFPEILLLGSPIYAPNYKVLFAAEEMKLRLHTILHPDIAHIKALLGRGNAPVSVKALADLYLKSDISPIYIKNPATENAVMTAVGTGRIKGILAHVIKGQTLHDFERKRIEQLTADCRIPLNRIETVYNDSDIEQIRLRLEAFSEMLNMKCARHKD